MAEHYQFDQGSIDVKVGEQFEISGRFPSITDKRKVAFPEDALKLVSEREGQVPKPQGGRRLGALPPVGSMTPMVYTLEALTEGIYEVEYLYFAAPQTLHNADKYVVNVTK